MILPNADNAASPADCYDPLRHEPTAEGQMRSTATPNWYPGSVIGCVRVSTDEQSLPEAQRAALKQW